MDYSSGSGVAATQTAVLYLPRGRCRCLRRCLYLVVKAAEAVGAETLAGSFARPIRRRSCGRGRGGTGGRAIYRQRRPQGSCGCAGSGSRGLPGRDGSSGSCKAEAETAAAKTETGTGAEFMAKAEPPGVWYVRRCQVKKRGAV